MEQTTTKRWAGPIPIVDPTPAAIDPSGERFYRPELDALRLFAFLSVFFWHALPGESRGAFHEVGAYGLCLFFLLSSYLITELLLRERNRTGSVHLGSFYVRRILRIWPLYFAMVGFGYVFGLLRPDSPWGIGRLLSHIFLVGNVYTARHGWVSNPAAALWSISVEEQFYVLWPSIVRAGTRWLKIFSASLIPLAYFWLWVLLQAGTSLQPGIWTNSVVQFQFFGIGALIALRFHGRIPSFTGSARVPMLVLGLTFWLLAGGVFEVLGGRGTVPLWRTIMGYGSVAVGCSLLCIGVLGAPASWFPRPLVFLGKISYGLYVFHLLGIRAAYSLAVRLHGFSGVSAALTALRVPIALVITVALAHLSYRYFETPFLRIKERFALVKSRDI
jgi:peptidoglycan/LPS O-acetylase OafA/YrhL